MLASVIDAAALYHYGAGLVRVVDGDTVHLDIDAGFYMHRADQSYRHGLIYGKLHDGKGGSCAMGAFWDDNPHLAVDTDVIDEVAAVNDSLPPSATPQQRWKKVVSWLRWKVRVMALKSNAA